MTNTDFSSNDKRKDTKEHGICQSPTPCQVKSYLELIATKRLLSGRYEWQREEEMVLDSLESCERAGVMVLGRPGFGEDLRQRAIVTISVCDNLCTAIRHTALHSIHKSALVDLLQSRTWTKQSEC